MTAAVRTLGRPWYWGCVALLLLNDHVLKAHLASWWTGKLSDLLGPIVVAVPLAVVLGRGPAIAATAAGFAALKCVPGVAEAMAPFVGGLTRRDATDLLGLVGLGPLWWLLGPSGGAPVPERLRRPLPAQPAPAVGGPPPWRGVAAGIVPVVGALTAVFATTATSCAGDPSVDQLHTVDGAVYAAVDPAPGDEEWFRSDDGGASWVHVGGGELPAVITATTDTSTTTSTTTAGSPPGGGAGDGTGQTVPDDVEQASGRRTEACDDDVCYRTSAERGVVERSDDAGSTWTEVLRWSEDRRDEADGPCVGEAALTHLTLDEIDGRTVPVVAAGTEGVLAPGDAGSWRVVGVGEAHRRDPGPVSRAVQVAAIAVGPVVALAVGVVAWRRGLVGLRILAVLLLWAVGLAGSGIVRFLGSDTSGAVAQSALVAAVIVAGVALARPRTRRSETPTGGGPPPGWPSPPGWPPPAGWAPLAPPPPPPPPRPR